jgi:hypothetical protein
MPAFEPLEQPNVYGQCSDPRSDPCYKYYFYSDRRTLTTLIFVFFSSRLFIISLQIVHRY